jgi:RNA polymerase sigma-54 factor
MGIEIKQTLRMSQQLVMTPQLQQAIKLLQLNRMELIDLVQNEMVENPVLEEGAGEGEAGEAAPEGADGADGGTTAEVAEIAADVQGTSEVPSMEANTAAAAAPTPAEAGAEIAEVKGDERAVSEIDWDQYLEHYSSAPPTPGGIRRDGEELPSLESTLTQRPSLYDHLMWQLRMSEDFDETEEDVAAFMIGNLGEDGYLREPPLDVIAEQFKEHYPDITPHDVWQVLRKLQRFDPIGIAARDLQECLLVQAETLGELTPDIERVIRYHISNLEKKNYAAIARDLKVEIPLVLELAEFITTELNPRPGAVYTSEDPVYVTPDVYVHKVGDRYFVVPNDDGLPKLRISNYYKNALASGGSGARDYIQDKLRSAQWLIRSIQQRQRTIIKVTESIVKFQREFLDKGINYLKPLILRDVAEDIGMHESTISRVTTNKYVHTPQGILELKFFFNSSINRVSGDALASESVKSKIKALVAKEDPKHPLSDQRIVELLKEQDIDIARRTVAKYREMLGILPSSRRRRLF